MDTTDLAIFCRGLEKRYPGNVMAVAGLDLAIPRGECFGLLGPNGAGKTTTVEIFEGLLEPTAGQVSVLGLSLDAQHSGMLRERIGITLQETHLPDRLTVFELVALFRSFYPKGLDPDDAIGLVSLEEKRDTYYERLSGGQKQRLAVACALIGDPQLVFLDEPTTGLDPQSRRQLWNVVSNLKNDGKTVLLTTHYMDEAERLCDRVAIVDRGRAIALGAPRELVTQVVGREIVELVVADSDKPLTSDNLLRLPAVQAVRRHGDSWMLTVAESHIAVPALLQTLATLQVPLERLRIQSASLD
ncbi:MAG: ABC transporter ATP-binding protein, partial [Pseudomonadota bacterium]